MQCAKAVSWPLGTALQVTEAAHYAEQVYVTAGDLKFIKRKDLCADLHASPLSNLARDFLTMAAPET